MKTKKLFGIFIFIALCAWQIHAQSFLTNGLVAYYPFNGNAEDISGHGNNGIVEGAVLTTNAFGEQNSAYYFNGDQSFILVSNSPSLEVGNRLTIGVWVNFSEGGTYNPRIISKTAVNGFELFTWGTSSQRQIGFITYADATILTSVQSLNAGEWAYLTVTYDGSQKSIYVNGVLDTSTPASCIFTNTGNLIIGQNAQNHQDNYVGVIDDIRIYNRALSVEEVAQLYAAEAMEPPWLFLKSEINLTVHQQSANKDNGITSVTAAPKIVKYGTSDFLKILATDKQLQGNWASNSFPKASQLVTDGTHFFVANGTNLLANVSDLMKIDFGTNEITSGTQNDATGLAYHADGKLQILTITFDDSGVNGSKNLKFYLQGVLSESTSDTTPVNNNFREKIIGNMSNGAGEGSLSDVNFICIGSVIISGQANLPLE